MPPGQQRLMFGMTFGYADPHAPENACGTDRAATDHLARFHR